MDKMFDTESICVMLREKDRYGFANEKVQLLNGKYNFHLKTYLASGRYDILHFHAMDRFLQFYRNRVDNEKTKIIMHYHGTAIRNQWAERRGFWENCDGILVSTKDLLHGSPLKAVHVPNVIDEELCRLNSFRGKHPNSALHVSRFAPDNAIKYAVDRGLNLVIMDREKTPMNHIDFIKYLSGFEYYIDVKTDTATKSYLLPELSLTGYEALMCGCKVIQWNGEVLEGFPEENLAVNVIPDLYEFYLGCARAEWK